MSPTNLSVNPVTQRDIASACNVHPSTICLALKNAPSIPLETRQRIQETALRMGYQPNASARNLAYLRTEKTKSSSSLPLAWLNQESDRDFWRRGREGRLIFSTARARASVHGYALTDLWAGEPGLRIPRLFQILRARGIEGVLCPIADAWSADLFVALQNEFSTVAVGHYEVGHWMDVVCPDFYHNMGLLLDAMPSGCRVGLVLDRAFDARSGGLARSRFMRDFQSNEATDFTPVCLVDQSPVGSDALWRWWRKFQPEIVICGGSFSVSTITGMVSNGTRVFSLQSLEVESVESVDDRSDAVALSAIESLVTKVKGRDRRCGRDSQRNLIKGLFDPATVAMGRRTSGSSISAG
jgi:DNA-binding LacI/PurR family transcriptional regulator